VVTNAKNNIAKPCALFQSTPPQGGDFKLHGYRYCRFNFNPHHRKVVTN